MIWLRGQDFILTCDLRETRTLYSSLWLPRATSDFFAALRSRGNLISVRHSEFRYRLPDLGKTCRQLLHLLFLYGVTVEN